MKLGVVTTSYPRSAGDPAGSFVGEHVQWLRGAGFEVDVIAVGDERGEHGGATRVDGRGLFYRGGAAEAIGGLRSGWAAARVSAAVVAAVAARGRDWDGVIAHWLAPSALACALATRAPMVAVAHSGDVHLLCRARLATATAALLAARRATVVFVSAALRARFALAVAPRFRDWVRGMPVCSMGVDVARFRGARVGDHERRDAVFLGRLVPIKGVDLLIDAAARTGLPLAIAGDGPERAALERYAGGNPRIAWLGEVRGDARDALLGRARVVVVPSRAGANGRTEGTPLVALEAMAAGAPVIASSTGGLAELPEDAVTRVAPGDIGALAAAIERVAADGPARRAQVRAADQFVVNRDWSLVGPQLVPR